MGLIHPRVTMSVVESSSSFGCGMAGKDLRQSRQCHHQPSARSRGASGLATASPEARALWYDKGYAIPAPGSCKLEEIADEGLV